MLSRSMIHSGRVHAARPLTQHVKRARPLTMPVRTLTMPNRLSGHRNPGSSSLHLPLSLLLCKLSVCSLLDR